jgi:glycosyltransferase involved in cell wall biosynthesis
VDRAGATTVRAVAVGLDGRRHELEPVHVEVTDTSPSSITPARAATLRDRFDQRIARLAPAGERSSRVMVAAHSLDLGGAQLYLSLLIDRLRSKGLELVVVSRSSGPLQAELEAQGVPVLVFGTDPRDRETLEGQVLQVAELAHELGVVGCLANSLPTFPAVIAAQRLGLPTAWAVHESFDLDTFWSEAYGRALPADVTEPAEAALAACDDVVFEARSTLRMYDHLVPAERRSLVPYGVDSSAIDRFLADHRASDVRRDLGLPEDELVLACVGTVEPRKGQLALLRALARIPAERRRGVRVVLVGMNDTAYAQAVRHFVVDAGLADAVTLVDVTGDIYPWYVASDVLVSASDIESVPRTMLEAMLLGRPVAATAAYGVAELVTDGRTGFLCEPLDLGALQALLDRVISAGRPALADMGGAAREHVLARHDPATYVDHFHDRLTAWVNGSRR